MRILHVWDQAGVACILAKYQRREGHFVTVIKRKGYDPFGIYAFYGEAELDITRDEFYEAVLQKARHYDIIHIHSIGRLVKRLKKEYPEKKIILHYHGSDLRDRLQGDGSEPADIVLLSTPDLRQHCQHGIYLPNPVDVEHFANGQPLKGDAFTIRTHLTEDVPVDAEIIDRQKNPVKYCDMPAFLRNYSTFIDMRKINGSLLQNLSKTALEALACGLTVTDYSGASLKGLPDRHHPANVVKQLEGIYNNGDSHLAEIAIT